MRHCRGGRKCPFLPERSKTGVDPGHHFAVRGQGHGRTGGAPVFFDGRAVHGARSAAHRFCARSGGRRCTGRDSGGHRTSAGIEQPRRRAPGQGAGARRGGPHGGRRADRGYRAAHRAGTRLGTGQGRRQRLGRPQPAQRMASVYPDAAPRNHPADPRQARQGRVAVRPRRPALPRRHQLVVGEPVRPRQPAHQRRAERPARYLGTRDAGRLHPRAGDRTVRKTRGPHRPRTGPQLLRQRRRVRRGNRPENEFSFVAQPRQDRQAGIRLPQGQLPRRDHRRAGRHRRRPVQGRLRPAAARFANGDVARCAPGPRWRNRRRDGPPGRRRRRAPVFGKGGPDRGHHHRAAGAMRHRHGDARPAVSATGARLVRPVFGAPDPRRNRRGLRAYRHLLRLRAGGRMARLRVPVQGHQRRLSAAVAGDDARRHLPGVLQQRRHARLFALALVHGQPAGVPRRAGHAADLRGRRCAQCQPGQVGQADRRAAAAGAARQAAGAGRPQPGAPAPHGRFAVRSARDGGRPRTAGLLQQRLPGPGQSPAAGRGHAGRRGDVRRRQRRIAPDQRPHASARAGGRAPGAVRGPAPGTPARPHLLHRLHGQPGHPLWPDGRRQGRRDFFRVAQPRFADRRRPPVARARARVPARGPRRPGGAARQQQRGHQTGGHRQRLQHGRRPGAAARAAGPVRAAQRLAGRGRRPRLRHAGRARSRRARTLRPALAVPGVHGHPGQGGRRGRRVRRGPRDGDRHADPESPALHLHHRRAAGHGARAAGQPGADRRRRGRPTPRSPGGIGGTIGRCPHGTAVAPLATRAVGHRDPTHPDRR
uniref:Uncharacterized protein n=1 Tax=Tanacetum cinerariifolium TaxID=118510 RepID=A0A699GHN8_TANCI|nr:hypothetical protein [Tanacetum cinerariifolium]